MVTRARAPGRSPTRGRSKPSFRHSAKILLDIGKYGGRWVATRMGEVVAVGRSYTDVAAKVTVLGLQDEVILTLVPSSGAFIS